MRRHLTDPYVQRARRAGYRSRAAYKLLEMHEKDGLIRPGFCVIDLGAAPGGWSQLAKRLVGEGGDVIAVDILDMEPPAGVRFLRGDFREAATLSALRELLAGRPVDLVLSDMAPNVSGVNAVDQPRAMYLCELALDLARDVLSPGGAMVVKVFQGEGFDDFVKAMRQSFGKVVTRKPAASRSQSREVYLVARNYVS